jgi:hypothetical protein
MSVVAKVFWTIVYLAVLFAMLYPIYLAFTELSWFSGFVATIILIVPITIVVLKIVGSYLPEPADEELDEEEITQEDLLGSFEAARYRAWEQIQSVLAEHQEELADRPPGERRMELLMLWRQSLDERAHAYSDLAAGHVNAQDVAALHAEAIMLAWSLGYATARGWLDDAEAQMNVHTLGRILRDQVRELGLEIEHLGLDMPLIVDETLAEIAALGREDGRSEG